MIRYPATLRPGDKIAVTSPSQFVATARTLYRSPAALVP